MYSICRMVMLHIKMHIFYMLDSHIAHKNAYIRPRPTGQVSGKKTVRRNIGKYLQNKNLPDRFRPIPDQVPEKCFFQGYRLCRPDAQNTEKHVCSIRRIAQNTEKHVYSICRIPTLHIKMHILYMPACHVAHKNACILYAGFPHCT